MTVQELINQLSLIEDKSQLVINYYDGWYNPYRSLATIDLYTSDDCTNLYDSNAEAKDGEKEIITKHCILLDTSCGVNTFPSDPQKYFYTEYK